MNDKTGLSQKFNPIDLEELVRQDRSVSMKEWADILGTASPQTAHYRINNRPYNLHIKEFVSLMEFLDITPVALFGWSAQARSSSEMTVRVGGVDVVSIGVDDGAVEVVVDGDIVYSAAVETKEADGVLDEPVMGNDGQYDKHAVNLPYVEPSDPIPADSIPF